MLIGVRSNVHGTCILKDSMVGRKQIIWKRKEFHWFVTKTLVTTCYGEKNGEGTVIRRRVPGWNIGEEKFSTDSL